MTKAVPDAGADQDVGGFWAWTLGSLVLGLTAFHLIFGRFFDVAGIMGDDYSYFLPALLEGVYWQSVNGWFAVPWFTPAQCSGIPAYPNPQNLYFSLPQLFAVYAGPIPAVYATLLLFAATGFLGMVAYVRLLLGRTLWPALVAGMLFLFCGILVQRALAGHFTFHLLYLVPLITWLLCRDYASHRGCWPAVVLAGALFAYMVFAGGAVVMPAAIAGVAVLGGLLGAIKGGASGFLLRLGGAGLIGMAMSASKLVAAFSWMKHFPRELYAKPGFGELVGLTEYLVRALFFRIPEARLNELLTNTPITYNEYSASLLLTPIPLLVLSLWLVMAALGRLPRAATRLMLRERWPIAWVVMLVLGCVALNYHSSAWSALLAVLPYLRNASNYLPFLFVPVIVLVVVTAIGISQLLPTAQPMRVVIGVALFLAIPGFNAWQDWAVEETQRYRPQAIDDAYHRLRAGASPPHIRQIAAYLNPLGRPGYALKGNELFTRGGSSLLCYEPLFGYRLESYPFGDLRLGPVQSPLSGGRLNLKRPECLIYPQANRCELGEHFRRDEVERLQRFVAYQQIDFATPWWQRLANGVSMIALIAAMGVGVWRGGVRLAARRQR